MSSWSLKIGLISSAETSFSKNLTQRNNTEDRTNLNAECTWHTTLEQSQYAYNATLRRVYETTSAMEKQ
jgi:hypothetical protein